MKGETRIDQPYLRDGQHIRAPSWGKPRQQMARFGSNPVTKRVYLLLIFRVPGGVAPRDFADAS